MADEKSGWDRPYSMNGGSAKKWHYFVSGRSLCGRWGLLNGRPEQGLDDSEDNCTKCRLRLIKFQALLAKKGVG